MTSGHTAFTTNRPFAARRGDDLGRRAVGRQHERGAGRHVVDVVDEHHAELAEPVDDEPVVDDLVVAVHGRLEDPHHPREGLDRHLDAGAEAARLGEQHLLHRQVIARASDTPGSGSRPVVRLTFGRPRAALRGHAVALSPGGR